MTIHDTLLSEQQNLVALIGDGVVSSLPVFRSVPRCELEAGIRLQVEWVLSSAGSASAAVADEDRTAFAAAGERQQRWGIPLDDMIHAWRIGVETLVSAARKMARSTAVGNGEPWRFTESMLICSAAALSETVGAYRRAELNAADALDSGRTRFVREVLLGLVPAVELRARAEMYGLDPAGAYVAIRARLEDGASLHDLQHGLGLGTGSQPRRGLCAVVDGGLAGLLVEAPPGDIDGAVGYGPARPLEQLGDSYRLAARALVTVQACKLTGAYDLEALGLRSAVAMDADVGAMLRRRYLEPLANGGSAEDLIATLRAYLACGMHVESTATRLFVHQNTVRYRLARFEELTGASLRETQVLLELWWALELSAMHM
ncbi:PucR family transcriptional regulator [Mycolicibacter icosiumassiliensis]|uniref:PucR family transcriptional regulator n=1 Tax=Mycolicibacter icosiumassiliensis TaxID=1792835 RepID=UPI00098EED77|nr:helix-turn-helix domain-containing protein [Mycolicibacter icosiumassiliensis]